MLTESERIAQVIQACMRSWHTHRAGLAGSAPPRTAAWLQPLCRALIAHTAGAHSGTELWTTAKWKTQLSTWLPEKLSRELPKQQWQAAVLRAVLGWHAAGCEHTPTARMEAMRMALSMYQQEQLAVEQSAHLPCDPARSTSWQQVLHVGAGNAALGSGLLDAGGAPHSKALDMKQRRVAERRATVALCRRVARMERQLKLAHAQAAVAGTAPIVDTPRTASPPRQPAVMASRTTQTPRAWQHALDSSPRRVLQRTQTPGEIIALASPSPALAHASPPRLRSPPLGGATQAPRSSLTHAHSASVVLSPLWSRRGVTPHVVQAGTAASGEWLVARLVAGDPATPPRKPAATQARTPTSRSLLGMSPAWACVLHEIGVASGTPAARRPCSPCARHSKVARG